MKEADGRRLVAIMFTDVVGYTELTERDEARAIDVRDRHRAILRSLVGQFEGEIVETPGDESLCLFPSALLAVDCALAVQAAVRDDPNLRLRIGIHAGDVLRRDGELIGEAVNLAARIRPLARPGGVCVSDAVWQQVRNRSHVQGHPLGSQRLKNVSEAVLVHALDAAGTRAPRPWWQRRRIQGAAVGLLLLAALAWAYRAPLVAQVVLWAPKLLATPVEQDLGFATTSDGVRIAYATSGSGPPVVMVIGWATHLEDGIGSPLYDPVDQVGALSREHLFVRYDGRGFGLSDRDASDFSLDARVRDLEAVVDALGLERFALFAVSAGGPAAIAYTARHPERVARLVLASTMASGDYIPAERRESFLRILGLVETDWGSPAVSRLFSEVLVKESDEVRSRVFAEFARRAGSGPAIAGFMRAQLDVDATEEARRIRVPTLVVHARDDEVVDLEAGRRLAALVPHARFEVIDGGHWEGIGNTPSTQARILDYLAEDTW